MQQNDDKSTTALADPLDSTVAGSGWMCSVCGVEVSRENTYCQVCLFSRPMDRRGVPQIFAGYRVHFNGVIPRTVKHPSHTVEWRMAERHGAACYSQFDVSQVNLLMYRPGYERSEKVRRCVEKDIGIPAVTVTWMLDCLLQSRQIHPAFYRLAAIPAVAQATTKGSDLPHHQHPYYQMNFEEYAIPTSFPVIKRTERPAAVGKVSQAVAAGVDMPPMFKLDDLRYTNVPTFDAVCDAVVPQKKIAANEDEFDEHYGDAREERQRNANVEILLCEQRLNKIDRMLFSGMSFVLSPALQSSAQVTKAIEACGGKVIAASGNDIKKVIRNGVTHVVYHHSDKKSDVMIDASQVKREIAGLSLVQSSWLEDCMMLGEVIPATGMYVPTAKLMETLSKKFERR